MTSSDAVLDCLRRAFQPTPLGVVGLTEQILAVCAGLDIEFERIGDRCVCRWTTDGNTHESQVPLPAAAFRALLAQIARLCIERVPNSVTPYRGECVLVAS